MNSDHLSLCSFFPLAVLRVCRKLELIEFGFHGEWWMRNEKFWCLCSFLTVIHICFPPEGPPSGSVWAELGQHDHQTEESHLDGRAEGKKKLLMVLKVTTVDLLVQAPVFFSLCRTLSWTSWGKPSSCWRSRTPSLRPPSTESSTHLSSHRKGRGQVSTHWWKQRNLKLQLIIFCQYFELMTVKYFFYSLYS